MVVGEAACNMLFMCQASLPSKRELLRELELLLLSNLTWILSGIANSDYNQYLTKYAFKGYGHPDCCMLGGSRDPSMYMPL